MKELYIPTVNVLYVLSQVTVQRSISIDSDPGSHVDRYVLYVVCRDDTMWQTVSLR